MDLGLRDKVCVVTGSTSGIGLETARLLCAEGARVVLVGRDHDRLTEARESCRAARGIRADLAQPGEPERVVRETVAELGQLDCLVNNLGVAYQARFEELEDPQWDDMWQLNVMSYVRAIRAAVPAMRERGGGVIVNVSSTAGKRPSTGMPNYTVTKAAVLSLSRLVADGPLLRPLELRDRRRVERGRRHRADHRLRTNRHTIGPRGSQTRDGSAGTLAPRGRRERSPALGGGVGAALGHVAFGRLVARRGRQ
jgi:hypothetical protein